MLTRGICYVAIGEDYFEQCRQGVVRLRKLSELPVLVTTDCDPRGSREWPADVTFRRVEPQPRKYSRWHKIRTINWSPFDVTMYLDTDTAVLRADFSEAFDWAARCDVLCSLHGDYHEKRGPSLPPGYAELVGPFALTWPLRIYKGGCWLFRKTRAARRFFAQWKHAWEWYGEARDMPPMMAAAQLAAPIQIDLLPDRWESHDGTHIRHAASGYVVPEVLNVPKFKPEPGRGKEWVRCPANTTPLPAAETEATDRV